MKNMKNLLKDIERYQNDEYVYEGLYEYLEFSKEEYDKETRQFIEKIDKEDFVYNVIIDIKEYIKFGGK